MFAVRIVLFACFLGSLPQVSLGQEWAAKMFETKVHDFGPVARGAKTEYAFEFVNKYEEDLHVSSVRSSCGCTLPRISKSDLKTWEKGQIICQFNTRSFVGQRQATVTVTFDKPFYAEVQLTVKGLIRSDVVTEPGEINFGDIDAGTAAEKSMKISYAGRSSWQIKDVRSENTNLEVRLERSNSATGNVAYTMNVKLKDTAPVGQFQDELTVVTDDAQYSKISLPVSANVRPPISVAPSTIDLGTLTDGAKKQQRLVLKASKPFEITSIDCDDPRLVFKIPTGSKQAHIVPVEFTADKQTGTFEKKITIKTSLGETISAQCVISGKVE